MDMVLVAEPKQVVAPGEVLAEGDHLLGDNAYRIGTKIFSACVGILEVDGNRVFVVPLKGGYFPRVGDLVAGRIVDIGLSGWLVDIRAPYEAMLPASETPGPRGPRRRDLSTSYEVGDMVLAEVLAFDRTRDPLLTVKGPGLGKVASGRVVEISAEDSASNWEKRVNDQHAEEGDGLPDNRGPEWRRYGLGQVSGEREGRGRSHIHGRT